MSAKKDKKQRKRRKKMLREYDVACRANTAAAERYNIAVTASVDPGYVDECYALAARANARVARLYDCAFIPTRRKAKKK